MQVTIHQSYTYEFKDYSNLPLSRELLKELMFDRSVTIDGEDNEYYEFGDAGSDWYCCIVEYVIDNPGHFFNTFTNKEVFNTSDIKPNIHEK